MTLTHGWSSYLQQLLWYIVRTTGLNKKYGPTSFGARHDPPNQSYRKLGTHTSAKTGKDRKRRSFRKLHMNRLRFQNWR